MYAVLYVLVHMHPCSVVSTCTHNTHSLHTLTPHANVCQYAHTHTHTHTRNNQYLARMHEKNTDYRIPTKRASWHSTPPRPPRHAFPPCSCHPQNTLMLHLPSASYEIVIELHHLFRHRFPPSTEQEKIGGENHVKSGCFFDDSVFFFFYDALFSLFISHACEPKSILRYARRMRKEAMGMAWEPSSLCCCAQQLQNRGGKKKRTCIWVKPKKRPRHREKNEQHGLEMDRGGIRKHAGSCQQHLPDPGEPLPLVAPGRGMHLRKMKMCASKLVFFGATRRNSIDDARKGPETMAQGP